MGKVLGTFDLGWPGAISRSVDDIVVALKNVDTAPIPFGAPVFMKSDGSGVENFKNTSAGGTPQSYDAFVGFAVRSADKTPDTYPTSQDYNTMSGGQEGAWNPGDIVEVLVRGCMAIACVAGAVPGGKVYIRKGDGSIVPTPGTEGSTVLLENVRCKAPQMGNGACDEIVVTSRHLQ